MVKFLSAVSICLVAFICDCSSPVAGGSSQQGNGIVTGCVITANGTPSGKTPVRIRSADYLVPLKSSTRNNTAINITTDSSGHFSFSGIHPGRYTVEANDQISSAALITVAVTEVDLPTDVGEVDLAPYAVITGVVSGTDISSQLYVQIRGLERLVPVENDGSFSLVDLPEGDFNLRLVTADSTVAPIELYGIDAASESVASVTVPSGWQYARRFRLNTTVSGADVSGSVINFPVLLRLTEEVVDFSHIKSDGSDIRFMKSDTVFLPYEIENWDIGNRQAELWVKVDTIKGNDSLQSLTMYWGNMEASAGSDGESVFSATDGFTAVWHLSTAGDTLRDATSNGFDGENYGTVASEGIIGDSREFTEEDHLKIQGLLGTPPNVTLSAWVWSEGSEGQEVVSIGDAVMIRIDEGASMGTTGYFHKDTLTETTSFFPTVSRQYLAKTGWRYLSYSINATQHTQTLYIDGAEYAVSADTSQIHYVGVGYDTYIGIHGNGKTLFNFIGRIDEVRIHHNAVSADWIKLCFMNQQTADKLVIW